MFYKNYFENSETFSSDKHKKLYEKYIHGSDISVQQWMKYTQSLRQDDANIKNLEPTIDDFMTNPSRPHFNPARASGNKEYDFENLISSDGGRIYTDESEYIHALSEWKYNTQKYKMEKSERKYADMMGLLLTSFE